jgi:hypothetical protein
MEYFSYICIAYSVGGMCYQKSTYKNGKNYNFQIIFYSPAPAGYFPAFFPFRVPVAGRGAVAALRLYPAGGGE